MRLFNRSKKEIKNTAHVKSASSGYAYFLNSLFNGSYNNIPITQSFVFYQSISPFYRAVNKIAVECASIAPVIYDSLTGQSIPNHPLLKVLDNPNSNATYYDFTKRAITHLLVSGNMFLRIKSVNENSPPLYIDAVDPRAVTVNQSATLDEYAWQYDITLTNESVSFVRQSLIDYRFFNDIRTQELYQIKDFCSSTDNLWGMPRTAPLFYDLEQFAFASRYNLAVLANGGRLSTIFKNTDIDLSPEDVQRLQQEVANSLSGPSNSGRQLVLNGNWEIQELGVSNKDMDFLKLKEHVTQNIYSVYEIPLPLVTTSTMTMGNYETATASLYDNAIFPTIGFYFKQLSKFLLARYKNSESLYIGYDPFSIPGLESRRLDQIKKRKDINVESINEIRTQMNLESLQTGGNDILDMAALTSVGSTTETISPSERDILNIEKSVLTIDYLNQFKNQEGLPLFTEEDIQCLRAKYGL